MIKKIIAFLTGRIVCHRCGSFITYNDGWMKFNNCKCGFDPNYDI